MVGIADDGFASLLDLNTGVCDTSLTIPPPVHLRRNTVEENAAYDALASADVIWMRKTVRPFACFIPKI